MWDWIGVLSPCARSVTHCIWKGPPSATEVTCFFYFSSHFLSHRRSSEVRATVIVTAAGNSASHREISQSVHPITKARLVDERLSPPRPLSVPANVLTLSTGSVRILADKIYTKKRRQKKNPTSLPNELTRADIYARQHNRAMVAFTRMYMRFQDSSPVPLFQRYS